jgi:hypothetical protein
MALDTYAELQSNIADWLHRTDLSAQIPNFIFLAERKISNNIRARQLEQSTTLTTTAGVQSLSLPTDYSSLKNISISGAVNTVLTLIPDDTLLKYNSNNVNGTPQFYCVQGNNILLSPVPDNSYALTVVYYQDVPPLSSTNTTNWLLREYPYIYLYGALIEASVYVNDPDQVQFYQGKFNDAIQDVWQNFAMESFSGSPLRSVSDYIM